MYLTPLQIMNLISALLQLKPFNAGKVVFVISSNTVFGGIEFVGLGHRKNEKSETRLVTSACCKCRLQDDDKYSTSNILFYSVQCN